MPKLLAIFKMRPTDRQTWPVLESRVQTANADQPTDGRMDGRAERQIEVDICVAHEYKKRKITIFQVTSFFFCK